MRPTGRQEVANVPAISESNDLDRMMFYAEQVAESRLFPGVSTTAAAFTLMALCQADGLAWIEAMRRYHIIEGRPSMRSDAMLATFQAKGGRVKWIQADETACEAEFSHPEHHPEPVRVRMTLARFEESGVAVSWKDGKRQLKTNWRNFPDAMLKARVSTAGIRMVLPGVVVGIYSPEEVEDFSLRPDQAPDLPAIAPFSASPNPTRSISPQPPSIDPEVIGQKEANDGRTYLQIVTGACEAVDEKLRDMASAVKVDPREVHRQLVHQAVQLGHHQGELPKTVAEAIKLLSGLLRTHRRWLREAINSYFAEFLANAAKPEETVTEDPDDDVIDVPFESTGEALPLKTEAPQEPIKAESEKPHHVNNPPVPRPGPMTPPPTQKAAPKANDLTIDAFIEDALRDAMAKFKAKYPNQSTEPSFRLIPASAIQVYKHCLKFGAEQEWCLYDKQAGVKTVVLELEALDEKRRVPLRVEVKRYITEKLEAAMEAAEIEVGGGRVYTAES